CCCRNQHEHTLHSQMENIRFAVQPFSLHLPYSSTTAITSISHSAFFGSVFTATQLLAGLEVKYLAYTSLNAAKSPMSARKQVVFTTLSKDVPAASRTAAIFWHARSACPSIPSARSPVAGSAPSCPAE